MDVDALAAILDSASKSGDDHPLARQPDLATQEQTMSIEFGDTVSGVVVIGDGTGKYRQKTPRKVVSGVVVGVYPFVISVVRIQSFADGTEYDVRVSPRG